MVDQITVEMVRAVWANLTKAAQEENLPIAGGKIGRLLTAALAAGWLPPPTKDGVERMARVVHRARFWPGDEASVRPFADEDRRSKEYCRRIARATLAAIRGEKK